MRKSDQWNDISIPKLVYLFKHNMTEVVACGTCKGTGFLLKNSDGHSPHMESCFQCDGEGRFVHERKHLVTITDIIVFVISDRRIRYTTAIDQGIQLHENTKTMVQYMLDFHDYSLEQKFPELSEKSKEAYLETLRQCELVDQLSK